MAGERPRGDRPRRSDVERELDRRDLGWGDFWQLQLFTAPLLFVGLGAVAWLFDRRAGLMGALTAGAAAVVFLSLIGAATHAWKRRLGRTELGVPPDEGQRLVRHVVVRDLGRTAAALGALGTLAVAVVVVADPAPGALRALLAGVAGLSLPVAALAGAGALWVARRRR